MIYSVIAIDGPAASGKSTVSRELAKRLGFSYVNSGSLYRAATWWALQKFAGAPSSGEELVNSLAEANFHSGLKDKASLVEVGGHRPQAELLTEEVNQSVSTISAFPEVRAFLLGRLRDYLQLDSIVMEGRDIGSVVFPDTPFKFYLDASPEERERRRSAQGLEDSIEKRDRIDSSRKAAPLKIASDACVVDSTNLTPHGVVEEILLRLAPRGVSPMVK